jgi:hypothetical protein
MYGHASEGERRPKELVPASVPSPASIYETSASSALNSNTIYPIMVSVSFRKASRRVTVRSLLECSHHARAYFLPGGMFTLRLSALADGPPVS